MKWFLILNFIGYQIRQNLYLRLSVTTIFQGVDRLLSTSKIYWYSTLPFEFAMETILCNFIYNITSHVSPYIYHAYTTYRPWTFILHEIEVHVSCTKATFTVIRFTFVITCTLKQIRNTVQTRPSLTGVNRGPISLELEMGISYKHFQIFSWMVIAERRLLTVYSSETNFIVFCDNLKKWGVDFLLV